MTYEEYKALPKLVKIIDVEDSASIERKEKLGGIFEIRSEYHQEKTLGIWDKEKSIYELFNENQVQRMTPVKINGEYIGVGDTFYFAREKYTVHNYSFSGDKVRVLAFDEYGESYSFFESEIKSHTPLYPKNKIELTNEQLVEELEKRGLLENGKILKA